MEMMSPPGLPGMAELRGAVDHDASSKSLSDDRAGCSSSQLTASCKRRACLTPRVQLLEIVAHAAVLEQRV